MSKFWLAAIMMLASACLVDSPESATEDAPSQVDVTEDALSIRTDPCSLVRCAAGYTCVSKGNKAQCIPIPGGAECRTDADCSLYSSYCGGCNCLALNPLESPPKCLDPVQCLIDPCSNKSAVCEDGYCVVSDGLIR